MTTETPRTLKDIALESRQRDRQEYIEKNISDFYDKQIQLLNDVLEGRTPMPETRVDFAYLLMIFSRAVPAAVAAATIERRETVKLTEMKVGEIRRFAKSEKKRIRGNVATTKCRTGMDFFLSVDEVTGELVVERTF